MAITDLPILSMLRTRLQWAQERQRVLAENVANADTPNYRAKDLAAPKFETPAAGPDGTAPPLMTVSLARTAPGHIGGIGQGDTTFRAQSETAYEVRPTGNAVNLEQEMMKVAANQMDYQAVSALYVRSLGLIKTALGKS
jgi:flagellar basal-body rod protein FlgB